MVIPRCYYVALAGRRMWIGEGKVRRQVTNGEVVRRGIMSVFENRGLQARVICQMISRTIQVTLEPYLYKN